MNVQHHRSKSFPKNIWRPHMPLSKSSFETYIVNIFCTAFLFLDPFFALFSSILGKNWIFNGGNSSIYIKIE